MKPSIRKFSRPKLTIGSFVITLAIISGCRTSVDRFVQTDLEVVDLAILCNADVDTAVVCDTIPATSNLDLKITFTLPDNSVSFDFNNTTVQVDTTALSITIIPAGRIDRGISIVNSDPTDQTAIIRISPILLRPGTFQVRLEGNNKTLTGSIVIIPVTASAAIPALRQNNWILQVSP